MRFALITLGVALFVSAIFADELRDDVRPEEDSAAENGDGAQTYSSKYGNNGGHRHGNRGHGGNGGYDSNSNEDDDDDDNYLGGSHHGSSSGGSGRTFICYSVGSSYGNDGYGSGGYRNSGYGNGHRGKKGNRGDRGPHVRPGTSGNRRPGSGHGSGSYNRKPYAAETVIV